MTGLPERVLAVGAHPDDIEILCAGTMALYANSGAKVTLCTATSGNRGGMSGSMEEIGRVRKEEARAAAAVIRAEYRCLELDDGEVADDVAARTPFVDLIRETCPDVVFTHDPGDYHPDHVATSKNILAASFLASIPLLETQLPASDRILPLFYIDTLAGIGFEPQAYVDITETMDTKRQMLSKHRSQVDWMRDHDRLDIIHFTETMSAFRGIQMGVRHAEGFRPARLWLRRYMQTLLPG